MDDQMNHEAPAAGGETVPQTARFDLAEFARRLMIARIKRDWRTVPPLVAAIDEHVDKHHLGRTITRSNLYRMERGVLVPDADEIQLLADVLEPGADIAPNGAVEYFMPMKAVEE